MAVNYLLTISAFAAIGARAANRLDMHSILFGTPVICLFILLFILAPYNVWKHDRLRVLGAEEAAKPKFTVHAVRSDLYLCLEVRSISKTEPIRGCIGRMQAVFYLSKGEKKKTHHQTFSMRWSKRHHSDDSPKHDIELGGTADLEVLYLSTCEGPNCRLRMPGAAKENYYTDTESPVYFFKVEVRADNASAVAVECFATLRYPTPHKRGYQNPLKQWIGGDRPKIDRFELVPPGGMDYKELLTAPSSDDDTGAP